MKKFLIAGLFFWTLTSSLANAGFVVEDIRLEGLERISAGTVFTYLPLELGDTMDETRSAQIIRALYKTGFFNDIQLSRSDNVVIIKVVERPAISSIDISGNEDFDTDELLENLKQIGLAQGNVFNQSVLDRVEQELQRQYFSAGKYSVNIETTVTPLERNRVSVAIDITEGKVAKIKSINIVGNQVYDDKTLLEDFQSGTSTILSFYNKKDRYSKQKLAADLETLRSFYQDRGYLDFNINSTQVSITPDKRHIYITVNIAEGDQFTVKEVKLAGERILPDAELFDKVYVSKGEIFSRKKVSESAARLSDRLGDEGYAFANVNTIPVIDRDAKEVEITFYVDPGKRVYVRRINMIGNTRTKDEVLRRELRQIEGAWFSTSNVNRSRTRIDRLGFFEEVNVETPAVPGSTDEVDVNFTVKERPSGSLQAGLGFSQSQGLLINASVSQENFLGTGNRVSVAFNNSEVNQVYSFAYNNPYYTIDGVSRGFSLFFRETDAAEANLTEYNTDTYGGRVNFGIPLSEYATLRVSSGYKNTRLTSLRAGSVADEFVQTYGREVDTIDFTAAWSYDTRNRVIFPDRGGVQRLSFEVTVPGLDLEYYKLSYRQQRYWPLTKKLTLSMRGEASVGDGYGDTGDLPFFENFYAGGPRSVRGYEENTLGPIDSATNNPKGGDLEITGNMELIFPVPIEKAPNSVRLSAFIDAGNVFAAGEDFELGKLRFSTGLAAIWLSPIGALSFSLAHPFNDQPEDETQVFQFSLGSAF